MISVCIATYNGARYIGEQIESILRQLGSTDEIIVSDDGSEDNTLDIVRSFDDCRIRIVDGPRKGSPISNFEKALSSSKGDYIFMADQDDVWTDDKVKTCMKYLKSHSCIVSDAVVVDSDLKETCDSFYKKNGTRQGKWYNLLAKNGYLGCCMAFNRQVLDSALPFPKDIPMHDIWIGNVAAFRFDVKFIDERLILFRRHNHNSSTTASKSSYSVNDKIMFRLNIIKGMLFQK